MDAERVEFLRNLERFSAETRQAMDKDAAQENNDVLLNYLESAFSVIAARCVTATPPTQIADIEVRDLWYITVQAAKNFHWNNSKHDSLVMLILRTKEMGTLSQTIIGIDGTPNTVIAQTSDGNIWTDLPFLVKDLQVAWFNSNALSAEHRRNLASFFARLVAIGICNNQLAACALMTFRDALETLIPLERSGSDVVPTLVDLLPAIQMWLLFASDKLIRLSEENFNISSQEIAVPGKLALDAGITGGGFSPARWRFWKGRLQALGQPDSEWPAFSVGDDATVKDKALACWSQMKNSSERINGSLTERKN